MELIVPILLRQLPNIVLGAEHIIAYLATVRAARMQNDEWTEEQEAQFLVGLKAHGVDPAYLTDANVGGITKAPPSNQPAPGTGTAPA